MSPEEFRRFGYDAIDWVVGYLRDVRELPVLPDIATGNIAKQLPSADPASGEPMDAILLSPSSSTSEDGAVDITGAAVRSLAS